MDRPSISELEALLAKMTPGFAGRGGVGCPSCVMEHDAAGLLAAHRAIPALLALAKAAMALEPAEAERAIARREWAVAENGGSADADRLLRNAVSADRKYNECRAAILSALQAVRP